MKNLPKKIAYLFASFFMGIGAVNATDNQTDALSPIFPDNDVPFRLVIETANFQLPVGLHSGVVGVYKGLWVFIAGRYNGLHGFNGTPTPPNFPPDQQNTSIYVMNPATGVTISRSLTDPSSGLTQAQVDHLSVTSPQGLQDGNTLYMTGGYGVDTATNTFGTKPVLTAIYLPGIVNWVQSGSPSVAANIRQIFNANFQVTGGELLKMGNTFQLIFGQNFIGDYTPGTNGEYVQQVRQFQLTEYNGQLYANILAPKPAIPDPNYRRRDLNVVPTLLNVGNKLQYGSVAYSGVFTLPGGIWTVPVIIDQNGNASMADPNAPSTFKQGMNNYISATASLYSKKYGNTYDIFFGGMSYGYFSGGAFQTDDEIPFINQVTTIRRDRNGNFAQFLMNAEYPVILSTFANPGNPLLFGAGAYFMNNNISQYANGVLNLDSIRGPTVIGYIVGGIQSSLANTNTMADSAGSPYVFKVTLIPK